jgi:hypothetical protein
MAASSLLKFKLNWNRQLIVFISIIALNSARSVMIFGFNCRLQISRHAAGIFKEHHIAAMPNVYFRW